ncbi:MAG: glycosyltransferase family 2 protein [Planctomycetaceae bacterium]|nr:glycosyltransferase family 2 protein [Planctomycetaceae bacterium]
MTADQITFLIIAWSVVLATVHLFLTLRLFTAFQLPKVPDVQPEQWPKVVAILALRGGDEFLEETLTRLTTMDYPDYDLRLILDSESDPARQIVEHFQATHCPKNIRILYLGDRPKSCSSKLASILRGTEELPADCQAVAIFDGDATVHPSCLREIVAPLLNGVALTTGNRWYAPTSATIGGLTRFLWNAFAVPVMAATNIPWGGCMAMQRDVITDPELRRRLASGFSDDTTLGAFVREQGRPIRFVPAATITNREDCTLSGFYRFLVRQYLTVRLHHPRWDFVFTSNVLLGITTTAVNLYLLSGASTFRWPVLAGYLIIVIALCIELGTGSYLVRRQKSLAGALVPRFSITHWCVLPAALFVLGHLNLVACLHTLLTRHHVWRGITYRFLGALPVEIIDVQPLAEQPFTKAIT